MRKTTSIAEEACRAIYRSFCRLGGRPSVLVIDQDAAFVVKLDTCGNLVFAGPPGLGKTMVAAGLGLHVINSGYTVCFEKMVSLVKILDTAETERTAGFRLKNLKKTQLIIIDEIGYTPITRSQANRFFTFISDTYETSSLLFTTNKKIIDWAEMMRDPVLTTALLERILYRAKCYSFQGESYRLKHPDLFN